MSELHNESQIKNFSTKNETSEIFKNESLSSTSLNTNTPSVSIPQNINVHQFYPDIEYSSDKGILSGEAELKCNSRSCLSSKSEFSTKQASEFLSSEISSHSNTSFLNTDNDNVYHIKDDCELFSTQVDESAIDAAKERLAESSGKLFEPENWRNIKLYKYNLSQVLNKKTQNYISDTLDLRNKKCFHEAIVSLTKAINLQPNNAILFTERAELYLQLCDFQSAILNYKHACVLEPENTENYSRLAFIYYFQGQCLFDQRLFPEALEAFSRASEMRPDVVGYHTRSIACLAALQRYGDCLSLVNKRLESDQTSADLFVLRARLHRLFKNITLCYYDVKEALNIEKDHTEAKQLIVELKDQAEQHKKQALHMHLVGRYRDALQSISMAIETEPSEPEYHIFRGVLHRRLCDFNSAIDDYLLAMDKAEHDETSVPYRDAQRQLLLTYNDFAVECFLKKFYEEAVILLNKAIKGEKNEKGLYINRGDCFFRQGDYKFSLADYHQAKDIDPTDIAIHTRIAVVYNEYGITAYQDLKYKEAEEQFSLAIQHSPKTCQYYISRSRCRQLMDNITGSQHDILMAMLIDPNNSEISSIVSRLFPGKSIRDVLNSQPATYAKMELDNLEIKTSQIKESETRKKINEIDLDDNVLSKKTTVSIKEMDNQNSKEKEECPIVGLPWKTGSFFPSIKLCMQEKQFNIKIAKVKKNVNSKVKNALNNRKSLVYEGGQVSQLPETSSVVHNGKVQKQEKKGWRNFSRGIGVPKKT